MDVKEIVGKLTVEEKAALCSGRDFWHTKEIERLGIPAMMMSDGPHGLRKQLDKGDHMGINESIKATCFPSACAMAASFDTELAELAGKTLGNECQAENLGLLLGPGVNIKRSPLCGRNFEYYSEDPYLAGQLGAALVRGVQSEGASSCVKHFAANNQETRRMSGNSVIDERTLHEIYLSAFETVVKEAKPRSVMSAYNQLNGTYCSENQELLTDILREKWGFEGFVVTDWGAAKDIVKSIDAGLDLEMPGGYESSAKKIVEAVENGTLPMEKLDRAVTNVLNMVGWWEQHQKRDAVYDRNADYETAAKAAAECAVLLKNDEHILPLGKEKSTVFIGAFAESPRYQGSGSSHINSTKVVSALDYAKENGISVTYAKGYEADTDKTDQELLNKAVEAAKSSEMAVIFAGLTDHYETEGCDRDSLEMPENQNELICAIAEVNPNIVVVLHNGSAIEMKWLGKVKAVLEMYLGGDGVGEAAVKLLYGDVNPSGRLPETFPKKLSDNPSYLNFPGVQGEVEYKEGVFVGYRYYDKKEMDVLFPFGYGMSYTSFEYSGLKLDQSEIDDTDILTVSVTVKNTGTRFGKEAVQLYVRDVESTVNRPVRELKGFAKIALEAGESKTVTFKLDKRAFAYYEPKIHDFYVESGEFAVEIGASSRDIRLSTEVQVNGTVELPMIFRLDSTIGDILATRKGKEVFAPMMAKMADNRPSAEQTNTDAMGSGASKMVQKMMEEMTLSGLTSFGGVSEEQLNGILTALNN